LPPANSVIFLPFATMIFDAYLAKSAASFLARLRLAGTTSLASIPWASMNLDARVQEVQPLRW
jgi:hypothetical protein